MTPASLHLVCLCRFEPLLVLKLSNQARHHRCDFYVCKFSIQDGLSSKSVPWCPVSLLIGLRLGHKFRLCRLLRPPKRIPSLRCGLRPPLSRLHQCPIRNGPNVQPQVNMPGSSRPKRGNNEWFPLMMHTPGKIINSAMCPRSRDKNYSVYPSVPNRIVCRCQGVEWRFCAQYV